MSEIDAREKARTRRTVMAFAIAGTMMLASCNHWPSESANQETERKIKLVLAEMIRRAKPEGRTTLVSGRIFLKIQDLDMSAVGVAVPNQNTGKRIWVSFTSEHFQNTGIDVLAREGLEDFERAVKLSERQKAQPNETGAK